jgi:hypothetical protein
LTSPQTELFRSAAFSSNAPVNFFAQGNRDIFQISTASQRFVGDKVELGPL